MIEATPAVKSLHEAGPQMRGFRPLCKSSSRQPWNWETKLHGGASSDCWRTSWRKSLRARRRLRQFLSEAPPVPGTKSASFTTSGAPGTLVGPSRRLVSSALRTWPQPRTVQRGAAWSRIPGSSKSRCASAVEQLTLGIHAQ